MPTSLFFRFFPIAATDSRLRSIEECTKGGFSSPKEARKNQLVRELTLNATTRIARHMVQKRVEWRQLFSEIGELEFLRRFSEDEVVAEALTEAVNRLAQRGDLSTQLWMLEHLQLSDAQKHTVIEALSGWIVREARNSVASDRALSLSQGRHLIERHAMLFPEAAWQALARWPDELEHSEWTGEITTHWVSTGTDSDAEVAGAVYRTIVIDLRPLKALAFQHLPRRTDEDVIGICARTDPATLETILTAALSESEAVSVAAIEALARLRRPEAVSTLVGLLRHHSAAVWRAAATALGAIGDKAALKPLATLDRERLADHAVVTAILTIGLQAPQEMKELFERADPALFKVAVAAAMKADADYWFVRSPAVTAIIRSKHGETVATLRTLLEQSAKANAASVAADNHALDMLRSAASALAYIGNEAALAALLDQEPDTVVRIARDIGEVVASSKERSWQHKLLLKRIQQLPPERSLELLFGMRQSAKFDAHAPTRDAFAQKWTGALNQADPAVRKKAISALSEIGGRAAVEMLTSRDEHEQDFELKQQIARALAKASSAR